VAYFLADRVYEKNHTKSNFSALT